MLIGDFISLGNDISGVILPAMTSLDEILSAVGQSIAVVLERTKVAFVFFRS